MAEKKPDSVPELKKHIDTGRSKPDLGKVIGDSKGQPQEIMQGLTPPKPPKPKA